MLGVVVDQVLQRLELGLLHDVHQRLAGLNLVVHDTVVASHCQAADVGAFVVDEEGAGGVSGLLEKRVSVRMTCAA